MAELGKTFSSVKRVIALRERSEIRRIWGPGDWTGVDDNDDDDDDDDDEEVGLCRLCLCGFFPRTSRPPGSACTLFAVVEVEDPLSPCITGFRNVLT